MGRQVTEKKIARDQLRAVAHHAEQANSAVYLAPRDLLALLDQAEARLAEEKHLRMKATAAATKAEARIEAVQHLIDQADEMGEWAITCTRLQWAIDGSAPHPGA